MSGEETLQNLDPEKPLIHQIIEMIGQGPKTAKEIIQKLSPDNPNLIRVYITQLKNMGKIRENGEIRDHNRVFELANTVFIPQMVYEQDRAILKKMIKKFVELDIEMELEDSEVDRIKKLYAEIKWNAEF